ncbi:MAG TPA: phosphotransferase, partial [Candidatus Dormibacteraeota bacterium]|nr:phosphotransferase [Candidatus Dormibacteraeota bacterium]
MATVEAMPRPRDRSPDLRRAETVLARVLGTAPNDLAWVPSDEADVFVVESGGERYALKLAFPDEPAPVWRESRSLPALRAHGFPVLEVCWTGDQFPDLGEVFHVTTAVPDMPLRQLESAAQAGLLHELGQTLRRLDAVDWRSIPRALSPDDAVTFVGGWWRGKYDAYLSSP